MSFRDDPGLGIQGTRALYWIPDQVRHDTSKVILRVYFLHSAVSMNTLHHKCVIPPGLDPGSRRNENTMRRLTVKIVHVTFMEKYSTPENENNIKRLSHYFHCNIRS